MNSINLFQECNLSGEFTLEIKDAATLEIREKIVHKNIITNRFILESSAYKNGTAFDYFTGVTVPYLTSLNISFSQENIPNGMRTVVGFEKFIATAATDTANLGAKVTYVDTNNSGLLDTIEIRQRLGFVGSIYSPVVAYDRTFRMVALTSLISSIDHTFSGGVPQYPNGTLPASVWAYVNLGSDFTQKANEIIDVTYRLRVPVLNGHKSNNLLAHELLYAVGSRNGESASESTLTRFRATRSLIFIPNYCRFPGEGYDNFNVRWAAANAKFATDSRETLFSRYGAARYDNTTTTESADTTETLGRFYAGIALGMIGDNMRISKGWTVHRPLETINYSSPKSPFQNIFSHSVTAFLPFQDNNNLAGGSGIPRLAGSWEDNFPEMYRIQILSGGAIGTSTYIWQRRRITDLVGNTFNSRFMNCPFTHHNSLANGKPFSTYHAQTGLRTHDLAYSDRQIVRYDENGVTLLNLVNGAYQCWDATTTPALPATQINHVAVIRSTGKIYVACQATGLWEITPGVSSTAINLVSTPCRSVSVGFGNVAYALFWNGIAFSLRNSNSWNSNLDFTFPLSNLNGSNNIALWFITADTSASGRIALSGTNAGDSIRTWWWIPGSVTVGPSESLSSLTNANYLTYRESRVDSLVSSVMGEWYRSLSGEARLYTFATTTAAWVNATTATRRLFGQAPVIDENGYLIGSRAAFKGTALVYNRNAPIDVDSGVAVYQSVVYLGRNLYFISRQNGEGDWIANWTSATRIASNNVDAAINTTNVLHPFSWESFSWNGTQWVSADPTWNGTQWVQPARTGKLTHLTTDALIGGLTIKFDELGTLGFRVNDWYSQVVALGVQKDNANNLSLTGSTYLLPTEVITASETHTIPAAAPHSVTVRKSSRGGSNPDPTFRWLDPDVIPLQAQIAGYPAPATIRTDMTIAPAINEILVNSSNGALICNPADASKALTISQYHIVKGDESRAIATPTPFAGIHNPVLLLRHDTGVIADGSGNITQWSDQSGYANHATGVAGSLPTLDSTLLVRGIPSIKFFTNHRRLILPERNPVDYSQGFTFIARIYRVNGNALKQVIFEARRANTEGSWLIFGFTTASFNVSHGGIVGNHVESSIADPDYNVWRTYTATFNPNTNTILLRINGQTVLNTTFNPALGRFYGASQPQTIGANASANNNWALPGNMSFLGIYNHYITVPELAVLEQAVVSIT